MKMQMDNFSSHVNLYSYSILQREKSHDAIFKIFKREFGADNSIIGTIIDDLELTKFPLFN